jgi:uncharacterized protein (TIGR02231 family)
MTRRFRALSLLAILTLPLPCYAADVPVTSRVDQALLYGDRAEVTRLGANVPLPQGDSTLVFTNLPENILLDSIRVTGEAPGKVIIGAIETKLTNSAELMAPREKALQEMLQSLRDQRALLEADQAALVKKQAFQSTLADQANMRAREDIATVDLNPDQWAAAADVIGKGLSDTLRAIAAGTVAIREIDEQIAATERNLQELSTGARASYTVKIPVSSTGPTGMAVRLTYQIPNAGWGPIYDARLDTKSGKLNLTQYGNVRQNTGEDWTGVKLVLSTAQPARGTSLPDLETQWIDLFDPNAVRMRAERQIMSSKVMGGAAPEAMASMDAVAPAPAIAPPELQEAQFESAQIETGGYVATYAIAGRTDVLADGSAKKVMIGDLDVSTDLIAVIKPQIAAEAYLTAKTKLGGETPLLPGQASLFRDGAFIGNTSLPLLRPGEDTELGFGIDDQVAVTYTTSKDEEGNAGMLGRDASHSKITKTEVQNLHSFAVKADVRQTLPVARNDKISVVLLKDATTPGYVEDVDNIKGQLSWTLDLQPQQKSDVDFGWTVTWPKDTNLNGL